VLVSDVVAECGVQVVGVLVQEAMWREDGELVRGVRI